MGSQQSFGDFANSLSFYGGAQQQEKKGYAMVSLQGAPTHSGSFGSKPAVPGFLGNILGTNAGSADLTGVVGGGGGRGFAGRLPSGSMKAPQRVQEQNGLIQTGLSAVKDGASRMLDGANSMVNATRATIADNPLTSQSMVMFGVVAAVGVLFMFLAFLTLPLLVFAPSKFALLFTMGSLCFLAALALLRGVSALSKHLIEPSRSELDVRHEITHSQETGNRQNAAQAAFTCYIIASKFAKVGVRKVFCACWARVLLIRRLPFTAVYFSSLFLTLYATLVAKSYVLTLVFSVLQLCGLSSFLVSYIPGGTHMIKFLGQAAWQVMRKVFKCGDSRDMSLPI